MTDRIKNMPSEPPSRRTSTPTDLFRISMNRLRRKKAPEPISSKEPLSSNQDALNALSAPAAVAPVMPPASPPLKKSGTRWRKDKKPTELKPQLDLTTALPSNDNFRTSLFMPGLSARFSMLREQDDPNSILGKASDDSVLQPRRRSRMDFGFANGGLSDISEVEVASTKSSLRPYYSQQPRQNSYVSEDGYNSENESTHSGSVMTRSRPGEGNTMFGGRQKVYMISKAGGGFSQNSGRTLYEDDVSESAFQQYRRKKQAEDSQKWKDDHGFDFGLDHSAAGDQDERHEPLPNDSAKDLSHSPTRSSSEKKRSTNSTSHSEARSSTAATSVASQPLTTTTSPTKGPSQSPLISAAPAPAMQPLKRQDTKSRRLYEQGLDQHIQEQQTSALTRLNTIQRQRALSNKQPPMYLHSTKSASNLHEKTRPPVFALEDNPPPSAPLLGPSGSNALLSSHSPSPAPSAPVSPMTPQFPVDAEGNTLTLALEPADRGKATAMGAFQKPKQAFDEQQYLERQRQLQRSASNAASKTKKDLAAGAVAQPLPLPADKEQERCDSSASDSVSSRSTPKKSHQPTAAYNVFQRAAEQINSESGAEQVDKTTLPDTHNTFFGNIQATDSEEEDDQRQNNSPSFKMPDYGYGTQHGRWQPTILPSVSEHPALRNQKSKASLAEDDEDSQLKPLQMQVPHSSRFDVGLLQTTAENVDSPTLGNAVEPTTTTTTTTTLNSLMHHLRQRSNVSSITAITDRASTNDIVESPSENAELNSRNLDLANRPIQSTISSDSRVGSYANSNPWDLDEADATNRPASRASISPIDSEELSPFASGSSSVKVRESAVSMLEPDADGNDQPWKATLQTIHTRDPSTATLEDRAAFDDELAARRTAIQESIKSKVESRSRNNSPAPSASTPFKAFGILRSKPSGEFAERNNSPPPPPPQPASNPFKFLAGQDRSGSSASLTSQKDASRPGADRGRKRDDSARRPSNSSSQPRIQARSRGNSESEQASRSSPSPPASGSSRSRANSVAPAGRARSRTGPYRDDLEKAMIEGTGSSAALVSELPPMGPRELTPRSSPDTNQGPFEPARARSNSRAAMASYFDSKNLQSLRTGSKERLSPAMPSPAGLSPNVYSPGLSPAASPGAISAPKSPAGSFAQNMTPPLSGQSTPVQATFAQPPQLPPSSGRPGGVLRKKTVSKGNISEPTLISSTSNIDLVDLPEGASLKNGMEEPPPLPPINPARRATRKILGFARKDSEDSISSRSVQSRRSPELEFPFEMVPPNHSRSNTLSPQKPKPKSGFDQSPGARPNGDPSNPGSPEKVDHPSLVPTSPEDEIPVMF